MTISYINPCVIGLDLSLTATGMAHPAGNVEVIRPERIERGVTGIPRIEIIRHRIEEVVLSHSLIELVMIEGYSFGSHNSYAREMAELGGTVRNMLYQEHIAYLDVAPNTLKKVATGNGRANKTEVVQAAEKRLGYEGHDDNEADALWLRAIGWFLMGETPAKLPAAQLKAIDVLMHAVPVLAPTGRTTT